MHQPTSAQAIIHSNKQKLIWGIIALTGPTVLLIIAFIFYAIMNFVFGSSLMTHEAPMRTVTNITLFLVGMLATITWLPGIIVGIILIAARKPVPTQ